MIAFIVAVLLFLFGMKILIEIFSAIVGTTLFTGIIIIWLIKASLNKKWVSKNRRGFKLTFVYFSIFWHFIAFNIAKKLYL